MGLSRVVTVAAVRPVALGLGRVVGRDDSPDYDQGCFPSFDFFCPVEANENLRVKYVTEDAMQRYCDYC